MYQKPCRFIADLDEEQAELAEYIESIDEDLSDVEMTYEDDDLDKLYDLILQKWNVKLQ